MKTLPKQTGMTLLELLICLSIISLLYYFITPFTASFFDKNQILIATDEIKSALHYAKLQTIIRGEKLLLVPRDKVKGWSSGLALYVGKKTDPHTLIYEWNRFPDNMRVSWHGFQSNHYLSFTPELAHNALNGTFLIETSQQSVQLKVNRLGRLND